jgi:mono/diheme cytochrome c family protein
MRLAGWGLLGFCCVIVGCAREPIPDYVLNEATRALPESHQRQIEGGLIRFFGRPTSPRWFAPGEEVSADEVPPSAESTGAAAEDDKASSEAQPESTSASAGDRQLVFGNVRLEEVADSRRLRNGAAVYRNECAGCHGISGDGNGPAAAYLQPKPRDYRKGIFKFTATPYGRKPVRADLVRTIRRGAKGTSMPAFPWMSQEDLNDVIDYVIALSQRGEMELTLAMVAASDYDAEDEIEPADFLDAAATVRQAWLDSEETVVLPVSAQPIYSDETIAAGRQAFVTLGCSKCHGEDAKGQTEWLSHEFLVQQAALPEDKRITINYDAWGEPAPAADLTARMLHGGRRPIDIYRRIYTGINGTPMPAFAQLEPDTIWHLVHYVLSIVEGRSVAAESPATASNPAS